MYKLISLSLVIVVFSNVGCTLKKIHEINTYKIIPQPVKLVMGRNSIN